MEYHEFVKEIVKEIEKEAAGKVTVMEVRKNNGESMDGLSIWKDGQGVSPLVYLNPYYRLYLSGMNMGEIAREIHEACRVSTLEGSIDAGSFSDFAWVRQRIVFRIVNYGMNGELLKELPHRKHLDLAAVFCCLIYSEEEKGTAYVLIRNEHLDCWGVDAEEIERLAYENAPRLLGHEFISMEQAKSWRERRMPILSSCQAAYMK